jgi:hypothetical protein
VQAHRDAVPELFRRSNRPGGSAKGRRLHHRAGSLGAGRRSSRRWSRCADLGRRPRGRRRAVAHVHLCEPWRGALVVASVLLAVAADRTAVLAVANISRSKRASVSIGCRRGSTRWIWRSSWLLGHASRRPALTGHARAHGKSRSLVVGVGVADLAGRTLALTWAAPRFIAPLFNRFSPLADEALKRRVESAARTLRIRGARRRVRHGRVAALGARQRLFHRHRAQQAHRVLRHAAGAHRGVGEIEAVLAHELGHFRLHHVRQRLARRRWSSCSRDGAARLAGARNRVLQRARRTGAVRCDGAVAVRGDRAGVRVLCHAGSCPGGRAVTSGRPTILRPRMPTARASLRRC